ncbi:hypothetical protein SISSUDRAFT_440914 [Sistotremastrum suecicum HHB10207 ss-3]|uniref:Uncharacterized protein n=1 Tax=Sistotremastrum suecicum HHB10207 ss-3 TaxID=1314776 RepID=A0A166FK49_9AGAM|nr:hypothetical protein SISSUDRAFT_440914 [Sistotremastrum suecicum HHB10207 ss-3]
MLVSENKKNWGSPEFDEVGWFALDIIIAGITHHWDQSPSVSSTAASARPEPPTFKLISPGTLSWPSMPPEGSDYMYTSSAPWSAIPWMYMNRRGVCGSVPHFKSLDRYQVHQLELLEERRSELSLTLDHWEREYVPEILGFESLTRLVLRLLLRSFRTRSFACMSHSGPGLGSMRSCTKFD